MANLGHVVVLVIESARPLRDHDLDIMKCLKIQTFETISISRPLKWEQFGLSRDLKVSSFH
jgi:hypothetical protein